MIYLDHNATTPVLPEVVEAMMPFFREEWGNPSSSYRFGSRVKKVIEAISLMWANNETGVLSPVEEIARKKTAAFDGKVGPLRDALEQGILTTIPQTELNGHPALRLANTTNITFHGIESEALLYNFTLQPPPLVAAWRNGKLNVHSSVDYESIRNR